MSNPGRKIQTSIPLNRIKLYLGWAAIFSIPIIILILINQLAIDLPIVDEWEYAKLIIKLRAGTITLSDLWAQHNEHRLFFPRLILITVHGMRGFWHIPDLVNLNWGFALMTFLLMLKLIWHLISQTSWRLLAAFASSLLLFTLTQDQTWLMGITNSWFLVNLLFIAALWLLSKKYPEQSRSRSLVLFLLAIVCTIIATYSTGTAFPIWIALIPMVWLSHMHKRPARAVFVWVLCAGLTLGLYFVNYHQSQGNPDLLFGLRNPISFILYISAYLGNPFSQGFPALISAILGCIGLLSFIYLVIALYRNKYISAIQQQIPIALVMFAVGNAIITAITRVGFGWEEQAMSSRYATVSVYFWIGLIWMEIIWLSSTKTNSLAVLIKENYLRFAGLILCIPMLILSGIASFESYRRAEPRYLERSNYLLPALYQYQKADDGSLSRLLPQRAGTVRDISASLEVLQEGPFSPLSKAIFLKNQTARRLAQQQVLQHLNKSAVQSNMITLNRGNPDTFTNKANTINVRALDDLGVYLLMDTGQDLCGSLIEIESISASYVVMNWDSGKGLNGDEPSIIHEFSEAAAGDPSKIKFYTQTPGCIKRARIDLHYANGMLLNDVVKVNIYNNPNP